MKRFLVFTFVIWAVMSWNPVLNSTAEGASRETALAVAKALDMFTRSARSKYTRDVVIKLKKDGVGAAIDSGSKKGFVPLPAQYIRSVTVDTAIKQKKAKESLFDVKLRSRWNLNAKQGLQDAFEKDGWAFLVKQQEGAKNFKKTKWRAFVRVETVKGKKTLRYFSADTAAASACVTCHNKWEGKDEVKKMRQAAGVDPGKVFKMNELMGALSISVPLE